MLVISIQVNYSAPIYTFAAVNVGLVEKSDLTAYDIYQFPSKNNYKKKVLGRILHKHEDGAVVLASKALEFASKLVPSEGIKPFKE